MTSAVNMKGILTLLVVIGHGIAMTSHNKGIINCVIYSFHVPAFLILSGILHNQKKWQKRGWAAFVIKRFRTLIIPYFIFELIAGIVKNIVSGKWTTLNAFGIMREVLVIFGNSARLKYYSEPSWYLPALFLAEILLFFTLSADDKQASKRHPITRAAMLAGIIISICVIHINPKILAIREIAIILIAYVFLAIGFLHKALFKKECSIRACILCFCILLLCAWLNSKVIIVHLSMRSLILLLISGIAGTILTLTVSRLRLPAITARIGKNSLIIYGTHYVIRDVLLIIHIAYQLGGLSVFSLYIICVFCLEAIAIPVIGRLLRFINQ